MGMKGPKAGNIYSSLKSRGLIGGKGKDPMLNCGSPFKVTDEKNKEKNKDNNSSNTQEKESKVGYIQDNESKIEGRAVRIIGSGSGKVLAERSPSPFKQTADTPAKFTEEGLSKLKAADIGGKFGEVIDKAVAKNSTPFKIKSNPKTSYGGFKKKGCYK